MAETNAPDLCRAASPIGEAECDRLRGHAGVHAANGSTWDRFEGGQSTDFPGTERGRGDTITVAPALMFPGDDAIRSVKMELMELDDETARFQPNLFGYGEGEAYLMHRQDWLDAGRPYTLQVTIEVQP